LYSTYKNTSFYILESYPCSKAEFHLFDLDNKVDIVIDYNTRTGVHTCEQQPCPNRHKTSNDLSSERILDLYQIIAQLTHNRYQQTVPHQENYIRPKRVLKEHIDIIPILDNYFEVEYTDPEPPELEYEPITGTTAVGGISTAAKDIDDSDNDSEVEDLLLDRSHYKDAKSQVEYEEEVRESASQISLTPPPPEINAPNWIYIPIIIEFDIVTLHFWP
jgi:hypothetical protein